jgi:hypothetical protein
MDKELATHKFIRLHLTRMMNPVMSASSLNSETNRPDAVAVLGLRGRIIGDTSELDRAVVFVMVGCDALPQESARVTLL